MQARPKRGAAQKANYVINYITLNFKEEQDIRKAIQASLSEARTSRRSSNVSNDLSFDEESDKDAPKAFTHSSKRNSQSTAIVAPVLASVAKKNEKRPASPTPSKDTGDNSTSITSISLPEKKKPKIPSQRKFAQNSTSLGSSTNTTPVKFGPFTPLMPTNEIFPAIKPATEDFLTFLCLRKTSLLPRKLNMFALNEEAMRNRKIDKPSAPKLNITPVKQEISQSSASIINTCSVNKSKTKSVDCNNSVTSNSNKPASRVSSDKCTKSSPSKSTCKTTSTRVNVKSESKKVTYPVQGKANRSLTSQSQSHHANNSNNHAYKNGSGNNSDTSTSNDHTGRERKSTSNGTKSKVKSEPPKRITRSTSNVNDDNVQTLSTKHNKPSNIAAKKLLQNSINSKKKSAPSHLSPSRGFVLDRVTRSIKHLRSMEEVSFFNFSSSN